MPAHSNFLVFPSVTVSADKTIHDLVLSISCFVSSIAWSWSSVSSNETFLKLFLPDSIHLYTNPSDCCLTAYNSTRSFSCNLNNSFLYLAFVSHWIVPSLFNRGFFGYPLLHISGSDPSVPQVYTRFAFGIDDLHIIFLRSSLLQFFPIPLYTPIPWFSWTT